ncbi:MAG: DEAD/DEAH box helicase [Candidatus Paceibacterota bacterium]
MGEQLHLDFSTSNVERRKKEQRRLQKAKKKHNKPTLFDLPPNIDVHLHTPYLALASFSSDPDRSLLFLQKLIPDLTRVQRKRYSFDPKYLDRLLHIRPPAVVTLDAASVAVARALYTNKLNLKPLLLEKKGRRLLARSNNWPKSITITDVPWNAVATLTRLGLPLEISQEAVTLFNQKLSKTDIPIASAGLQGSSVTLKTTRPDLLEALLIPALAYDGGKDTGSYRLPLLSSAPLLDIPQISKTTELEEAIKKATRDIKPFNEPLPSFPWKLYPFQSIDVAKSLRVLEHTGGVLLAAEMGSGKTTMALAITQHLDLYPLLIVAPLSAFSTWQTQLKAMGRDPYLTTDPAKKVWDEIKSGKHDAVVISFDKIFAFTEVIEHARFKAVIADEIQRIRTPGSRRSRALRALASAVPYRIGLSGTPLTNTINDLLPLGAFLVPGEWPPRANEKTLQDLYPNDPVDSIAEHLASIMVRRRMTEVGAKLPKRHVRRVYVDLTAEQRAAINILKSETEKDKELGLYDGNQGRIHAFARLSKLKQIINSPEVANVAGPNPKVKLALELTQAFIDNDRKGVLFCSDRSTFALLSSELDKRGIKHVKIWGSTPTKKRIEYEKQFHTDPETKVVLCTIQAGSESWSASPTATWLVSTSYMYAPAILDQMEARVYRMSSDPNGHEIEICYIHATAPGGTLDDRMVEILAQKRELFSLVVDRKEHLDNTKVHYSLNDLLYLLTGSTDESVAIFEKDNKEKIKREQESANRAKSSAHKKKYRNNSKIYHDDKSKTLTLQEYQRALDELDLKLDNE